MSECLFACELNLKKGKTISNALPFSLNKNISDFILTLPVKNQTLTRVLIRMFGYPKIVGEDIILPPYMQSFKTSGRLIASPTDIKISVDVVLSMM